MTEAASEQQGNLRTTNTNYVFVAVKEEGGDDMAMLSVLKRTPPGKKRRGRQLGTWRETVEEEIKLAEKTWE